MNHFDYLLIATIGLSALLGLWRGFLVELVLLVPWVVSIGAAVYCLSFSTHFLLPYIHGSFLRMIASFVLIFLPIFIVLSILAALIRLVLKEVGGFSASNRLLGLLLGLIRGSLIVLLILSGLQSFGFEKAPWWQASKIAPLALPGFNETEVQEFVNERPWLQQRIQKMQSSG